MSLPMCRDSNSWRRSSRLELVKSSSTGCSPSTGRDPNHPAGAAATLGAPQPAPLWTFAHGEVNDGIAETVTVMNPGNDPAQVQVEITLDDPDTNGVVDPIPLTIPPHGYSQVAMQDQTRVPKGVTHSITVRSTGGPGVIAERDIRGLAAAPAGRRGYGPSLGSPLWATRWLFADGGALSGTSDEVLIVYNPSSDNISHVSITALAQGQLVPVDGLQDVEVPPRGRVTLDLGSRINRSDLTVIAESSQAGRDRAQLHGGGRVVLLARHPPVGDDVAAPLTAADGPGPTERPGSV